MAPTPESLATLALLTVAIPWGVTAALRRRPELAEALRLLMTRGIWPSQEDFLIGFSLFIVFCGILMGWMLLFVGVVRQGMLH
ncbi:MAG TPA: hypothetical protein VEI97_19950 [bacterium]|nr:hypothetical protein [bacterium]